MKLLSHIEWSLFETILDVSIVLEARNSGRKNTLDKRILQITCRRITWKTAFITQRWHTTHQPSPTPPPPAFSDHVSPMLQAAPHPPSALPAPLEHTTPLLVPPRATLRTRYLAPPRHIQVLHECIWWPLSPSRPIMITTNACRTLHSSGITRKVIALCDCPSRAAGASSCSLCPAGSYYGSTGTRQSHEILSILAFWEWEGSWIR